MDFFLLAVLVTISVVDLRSRRIPDMLSLPLGVAGLILPLDAGLTDRIAGAVVGYAIFAVIGAAFFRLRRTEGLGLGDAKLLAAAGAWLGWQALPPLILIAALGGLAQAGVAHWIARRRTADAPDPTLAFGPWLAVAFYALWMLRA